MFKSQRELIYMQPGMYIGAVWNGSKWDKEGLEALVMLVISQVVKPSTLNQCNVLKVSLKSEDEIIIEDDGRGLSVALLDQFEKPTARLAYLLEGYMPTGELTQEYYRAYGFLDYLARLLNVLSESLKIDTVWEGQAYMVVCSRGDTVTPLQKTDDSTLTRGTRIYFKPDPDIFASPAFREGSLKSEINALANEFPQVSFEFNGISNNPLDAKTTSAT